MRTEKPLVPQGPQLVAPPSLRLVAASLCLGYVFTLLPWPAGARWAVPDFTLVVLLYWTIHAPRVARLGLAFWLGLLADVTLGMHIGQHALTYVLTAFVALSLRRRLENFRVAGRGLHLAPLFLAQQAALMLLGLAFGAPGGDWRYLLAGVSAALTWLPVAWLLDHLTGWSNVMRIEPAEYGTTAAREGTQRWRVRGRDGQ